ncbi:hypothetical protein [Dyella sp. 2RAB6]|uniref:hypothetical protein n=1 Tax=Dyella sp. 2RAB6 TaxID=3232992 RepID=UPI003F8E943D
MNLKKVMGLARFPSNFNKLFKHGTRVVTFPTGGYFFIFRKRSNGEMKPMSNEQVRWLLKVIQPERTLASLPGAASLGLGAHAALLGLPEDIYATELARMQQEASEAAEELLADPAVASMVDRLPLRKGAKVMAFGDSLTSEPQSWAVIMREVLARRRGTDEISLSISAIGGETTTHGLVRACGCGLVRSA